MTLRLHRKQRREPCGAQAIHAQTVAELRSRRRRLINLFVSVQSHEQFAARAIVSPTPYAKMAREAYHEGWRTKQD